jgi:hypothetical protein
VVPAASQSTFFQTTIALSLPPLRTYSSKKSTAPTQELSLCETNVSIL